VGLGLGIKVGSADNGVGSRVLGNLVGLGLGTRDGIELGDGVGIMVGEGVVGDGVDSGVGASVGEGVGPHVVHSRVRVTSIPPSRKVVSKIFH